MITTRTAAPRVGKAIYEICNPIVRSFPIVAEQGANYPFMVYRRTSHNSQNTKDRYNYLVSISMELVIVSDRYEDSVNLSQQVWEALDKEGGVIAGVEIQEIRVTSTSEDYINDAYVQRLQIEVDVTDIVN